MPYLFRSYELSPEAFSRAEFLGKKRHSDAQLTHSLTHSHVDCVCCGETGTSKCECWEAVRATTAAPTYYSPAVIGGQKFVDGAILANNPTLIALVRDSTCPPSALTPSLTHAPRPPSRLPRAKQLCCGRVDPSQLWSPLGRLSRRPPPRLPMAWCRG